MAIWGVGALAIICCAFGVMLSQAHAEIDDLEKNISTLERYTDDLEEENRRLRARIGRRGA